jgi:hypothetical protein
VSFIAAGGTVGVLARLKWVLIGRWLSLVSWHCLVKSPSRPNQWV